jgi:hypothetical protein
MLEGQRGELLPNGKAGNGRSFDNVKATAGGNSADYTKRRLKRDRPDLYEKVISGDMTAKQAGLSTLPCWVRDLPDSDAYMQLVLCNTQSELHPLERGLHALGFVEKGVHGKSAAAYAKAAGRENETRAVQREIDAATVADEIGHVANLTEWFRQISEIHAAPKWLWALPTNGRNRHPHRLCRHVNMVMMVNMIQPENRLRGKFVARFPTVPPR